MSRSFKSSNFLEVIDRHARKQKAKIKDEIKEMEKRELQKAEAEIMEDTNNMIQKELVNMKSKIVVEVSHKEIKERKRVSQRRLEIMKEIFEESRERLIGFTSSKKYAEILKNYASNMAKVLTGSDAQIFIKPSDEKYSGLVKEAFGKECKIVLADDILIGGIRGYSASRGIIADETFDAKLKEQEDWAASNFGVLLI